MTTTEQIVNHVKALPESARAEVLDFIEFLESKAQNTRWSEFSLANAMRDMESEESPYSLNDIKERFSDT